MNLELDNQQVVQVVATIWESVLALDCADAGVDASAADVGPGALAACVQITGGWKGAVVLVCGQAFATHAADAMFGPVGPDGRSATDRQDAVAELANMIGGNLKGLLPCDEPCQLSLPTVVAGADYTARVPGSRPVNRVTLACGGHVVVVNILEKIPAALAA